MIVSNFCHWWKFNWGEARLAKPTLQLRKIKKVFTNFPRGFWRFQQNFNGSKIVLSSSRGQGNFRGPKASRPRTWGFEAKAKDFKMCRRGQGRPRGLHLWLLHILYLFLNYIETKNILLVFATVYCTFSFFSILNTNSQDFETNDK